MSGLKITQFGTGLDPAVRVAAAATASSTPLGGDLSGTPPAAVVAAINGVAITGTPAAGDEIIATSPTAAHWATPTGGSLEIKEADGSPDVTGVTKIVLPNGSLTDDTGGQITITFPGGGGVIVQDEGTPLATTADTLNFAGAGVTATGSGTTKTITIAGGAAPTEIVDIPTAETDASLVLAPDGIGGVEFRAEAGGGATGVDAIPGSPSAYDEEFNASLSGFTNLGSLDTNDANVAPGFYRAVNTSIGTWNVNGIYKACPSVPFTVTAKFADYTAGQNYAQVGLLLTESSPGKLFLFGPLFTGGPSIYETHWTNRTSRAGYTGGPGNTGYRYLRLIVTSGTNVSCDISVTGVLWTRVFSGINCSLTPANVGIAITGNDAGGFLVAAGVDWMRFKLGTVGQTWNGTDWV